MNTEKLRKLISLLVLDGSVSICDTCINSNNGIGFCPYLDGRCGSTLNHYEPNEGYLE
jgi:hypothetical protein